MTLPVEELSSIAAAVPPVVFHRLTAAWVDGLGALLSALAAAGDDRLFHPHAGDAATLHDLAVAGAAPGDHDEYHVAASPAGAVLAYGLLRGWAAGYAVPSLGVAVHPAARGRGLARLTMEHLHAVARARGARRVRLKVYRDNPRALALYRALGYRMEPLGEREWCGLLELDSPVSGSAA